MNRFPLIFVSWTEMRLYIVMPPPQPNWFAFDGLPAMFALIVFALMIGAEL